VVFRVQAHRVVGNDSIDVEIAGIVIATTSALGTVATANAAGIEERGTKANASAVTQFVEAVANSAEIQLSSATAFAEAISHVAARTVAILARVTVTSAHAARVSDLFTKAYAVTANIPGIAAAHSTQVILYRPTAGALAVKARLALSEAVVVVHSWCIFKVQTAGVGNAGVRAVVARSGVSATGARRRVTGADSASIQFRTSVALSKAVDCASGAKV